ncbi:class I SAM-dependent methyltransferase [Salinisphaera sp. T31B1]|uniref:O-methyltransferase n=1 Tax=Salinisphaera sp. T31B1 TaxID=727963 RepID=UPI003340736F
MLPFLSRLRASLQAMIDRTLLSYLRDVSLHETDVMRANRRTTEAGDSAHLQIDPEQGQLMALLVRMLGARRGIEIGVFAGYSSLWLAAAMGEDGHLLACDIDEQITRRARADWQAEGLSERIELVLAPARETLDAELAVGRHEQYDFVFIDADKAGYIDYYERALALLRSGGLVMADNTLWYGRVADETDQDADTLAIRAFNRHLYADERVEMSLVPIGDGLTVARKR